MALFNLLNFILLILFSFNGKAISEHSCGDWEPWGDEKCIKLLFEFGLVTYEEAGWLCEGQDKAQLLTISSEEKQNFTETILRNGSVVDYVWLGLTSENGTYRWPDGSELTYANWAEGSPKNESECVQIQTDEIEFGKWSDADCEKRNFALCERLQRWSIDEIQIGLMNLIKNPVPVGFVYVQLPKEKFPEEIWPTVVWQDVTSDYAGLFFRAEGGNSSAFGNVQEESTRSVGAYVHLNSDCSTVSDSYGAVNTEIAPGECLVTHVVQEASDYGHHTLFVGSEEVRPINTAVRVWKRTE